jgi:hypothetical protein
MVKYNWYFLGSGLTMGMASSLIGLSSTKAIFFGAAMFTSIWLVAKGMGVRT